MTVLALTRSSSYPLLFCVKNFQCFNSGQFTPLCTLLFAHFAFIKVADYLCTEHITQTSDIKIADVDIGEF